MLYGKGKGASYQITHHCPSQCHLLFIRIFLPPLLFLFQSSPFSMSPEFLHFRIPHPSLSLILSKQTTSTLKHPCRLCLRKGQPLFCVLALALQWHGLEKCLFIFVWMRRLSIQCELGNEYAHGRGDSVSDNATSLAPFKPQCQLGKGHHKWP